MNWLTKQNTLHFKDAAVGLLRSGWRIARGLFPLTWVSVVLLALIYYVWFWEVSAHANQILYSVAALWIFVVAVLLIFTLLGSVMVFGFTRRACKKMILEAKNETGGHVQSKYRVYNPIFLPFIAVDVELEEKSIERREKRRLFWITESLVPRERGRYLSLHRKVTVHDIFGLTSITFVLRQGACLEIKPATSHFEMVAFQTRTSGDGYSHPEGDPRGELVEMRRYQAGDPLRLVIWKVFARSRKLVVRAPEPAIVEENDMFVYFVSGQDDETSASMARSFLAAFGNDKKELCFAADGAQRIVSDETDGVNDVIDSVGHRKRGGEDLMTVAPLVKAGAMAHCFLLVPPKMGKWFDFVKTFIGQYRVSPIFVVSVDARKENKQSAKASFLRRFLCSDENNKDEEAEFTSLCQSLSKLGTVRIVDISTGASTEYAGGAR